MTQSEAAKTRSVVAVFNQKGGISKTTTATNLALCLAALGNKVLVIDLDAQGDSTKNLCQTTKFEDGIYELLAGDSPLDRVIHDTLYSGIRIIPATYDLAGIEIELHKKFGAGDWQTMLRDRLLGDELPYDFVVIDCPPGLGFLPVNALAAAGGVLVPVTATPLAYDALARTLPIVEYIQGRLNKKLQIHGILLSLVENNLITNKTLAQVKEKFAARLYRNEIPLDYDVVDASGYRLPVTVFDPDAKASRAFLAFAAEFLERHDALARRTESGAPGWRPQNYHKAEIDAAREKLKGWSAERTQGIVRDKAAFAQNKASLRLALDGRKGTGERIGFFLINFAIHYKWIFFPVLFILLMGLAALGYLGWVYAETGHLPTVPGVPALPGMPGGSGTPGQP